MQIVSGKLKGRIIHTLKNVRAVEARIKKVLYNLLKEKVVSAKVLDLFAGAGSLGIEALSWGAAEVVFVEKKKACVQILKKNLSSLKIYNQARVYLKDCFQAVQEFSRNKELFDLIFLDPPYYKGLITKSLKTFKACDILKPFGFIISLGFRKEVPEREGFFCLFSRAYGDRLLEILSKEDENNISGQF